MSALKDCLTKAVKGELLTEEESAFVSQKAAAQTGMTRKEAELWAAKDMLRDAIGELDSIARQVGKPAGAPTRKSTVVLKTKDPDMAMAAMLEEHQIVAEKRIAAKREEEQGVIGPQTQAEAELEAAAPGEKGAAKQTRTYEAMREKVLGLIERNRQLIREREFKEGMTIGGAPLTAAEMKAQGITEESVLRIQHQKLLAALGELNAVMKFMPPEVRGKAGGFFQIAKSGEPLGAILSERLERVQAELDKLMSADYRERVEKLIKSAGIKTREGKKVGTLGAEPQTVVDAITKAAAMDAAAGAKRMQAIDAELTAGNLTPEQELELREEWAIVNSFSDLASRPVEHLADVYHQLKDFVSEARKNWRLKQEARMAQDRTHAAQIIEGLGEATKKGLGRISETDILATLRSFTLSHGSLAQFLRAILPENVALRETWWKQAMKAENKSHDQLLSAGDRMTVALQEALGSKSPFQMGKALKELKDRTIELTMPKKAGSSETETFPLSKLEAIQFILSWDQPDVRLKMMPHGWTVEAIHELREATSDPMSQAMQNFLRQEYDATYQQINPVYREMFGIDMPRVVLYAPTRFHNPSAQPDLTAFGVPVSQSGITAGFLQARVGHNNKMRQEDAMTVYWQHLNQLTHWANHALLLREMRAVMGNVDVSNALKSRYGEAIASNMTKWLNAIATQGHSKSDDLVATHYMVSGLVTSKALSSLALNWRTVAMQTDSLLRFGLTVPMRRAIAALTDRNFFKNIPAAFHSDAVQRRLMGGGTATTRYMFDKAQMTPSIVLQLTRMGMLPMQLYDTALTSISGAIVYTDAYNEAIKQGNAEAQAEEMAAEAMEESVWRTAQPIGITNRALIAHTGNVWMKMAHMFITDPTFKMTMMWESSKGLVTGKGEGGRGMALQRLLVLEAAAWTSQTVANIFRELFRQDDDEEIWTVEGYAYASLLPFLNGMFVVGAVAEGMMAAIFGQKWWAPAANPLVESLERGKTAAKHLGDLLDTDHPEKIFKEAEHIARALTSAGIIAGPVYAPFVAMPAMVLNFIKPIVAGIQKATKEEE